MMMLCGQPFVAMGASEVDAMFSIQYVAANALIRHSSQLSHFTRTAIIDPRVTSLAQRLAVVPEPSFSPADKCEIEITTTGGFSHRVRAQDGRGWPQNPLTPQELDAKLRQCAEFSGLAFGVGSTEAIAHEVWNLDALPDVRPFIRQHLIRKPAF